MRMPKIGLSGQILIGLGAGVLAGLFVGEPAAALQPLADIYIRLMQMTVLPYLVLTLIVGLGRMDAAAAKRLAVRGTLLLALFWALALAVVGLMPLAFPRHGKRVLLQHVAARDAPAARAARDLRRRRIPSTPWRTR